MQAFFRFMFWLFLLLYLGALFIAGVGMFGWFGTQPDALSAVYLVVLSFPWLLLANLLPDAAGRWFVICAPLLNLALIAWISTWLGKRAKPAERSPPATR